MHWHNRQHYLSSSLPPAIVEYCLHNE
jgi:hypothetical protein